MFAGLLPRRKAISPDWSWRGRKTNRDGVSEGKRRVRYNLRWEIIVSTRNLQTCKLVEKKPIRQSFDNVHSPSYQYPISIPPAINLTFTIYVQKNKTQESSLGVDKIQISFFYFSFSDNILLYMGVFYSVSLTYPHNYS